MNPKRGNKRKIKKSKADSNLIYARAHYISIFFIYTSFIFIFPIYWYFKNRNYLLHKKALINKTIENLEKEVKKRFDVLNKLVKSCKNSINFERGLINRLTKLGQSNTKLAVKISDSKKIQAQILSVIEDVPNLHSVEKINLLIHNVIDLENTISASRKLYNAYARDFNHDIFKWPLNVIACKMKLAKIPVFTNHRNKILNTSLSMDV